MLTSTKTNNEMAAELMHPFIMNLDNKMNQLLSGIEKSEMYLQLTSPATDPLLIAKIIKYTMLEVFSYGPHVTEATFMAISRLPKRKTDLMRPLVRHLLSEVGHGEMALDDFVRLGGDEKWARSRRITPASFAMAGTCRALAQFESPFAYLGYMYPFEALTPILTQRIQLILKEKNFPKKAQMFIDLHATEDIGHTELLGKLIARIVDEYSEAASAIEYGFDCFSSVYPLPIWKEILSNARSEMES